MSDKHRTIIGLDPGASTGVAVYIGGKLEKLATVEPWRIPEVIQAHGASRVVFEDSRLTSFMFTTVKSRPAALKMARNVGEIDAWSKLICAVCEHLKIPAHSISPKQKGAKLDAKAFERLTGWTSQSNQHERDAAAVAWPYRSAA
jgi:predicted RNase H-like nuclease (RuvC/YqgF family)